MSAVLIPWLTEIESVVRGLVGPGLGGVEFGVTLGVGLVALVIVLRATAFAMGASMVTIPRTLLVVALGAGLLLLATAALRLHVLPNLEAAPGVRWLPLMLAIVVGLGVVAPLARWILAGRYFSCVFALALGAAALAAAVVVTHAAFGAFWSGDKRFEKTRTRRDSVNQVILGEQGGG